MQVAATPRRRTVLATPSSPVESAASHTVNHATRASQPPYGDEAPPLLAPSNFGIRVCASANPVDGIVPGLVLCSVVGIVFGTNPAWKVQTSTRVNPCAMNKCAEGGSSRSAYSHIRHQVHFKSLKIWDAFWLAWISAAASSLSASGITASCCRGCASRYALSSRSVPKASSRCAPERLGKEWSIIITDVSICISKSSSALVRCPSCNWVRTILACKASDCA